MKMFRKEEGFTLVELMVVVLIIGILVAVAIPVFNNASESARRRTCHANQRTIEGAVQQYLASNPTYTITAGAVDAASVYVSGGYIKTAPSCPSGAAGNTYSINASGTVGNCANGTPNHQHF